MTTNKGLFTSLKDDWETPQIEYINPMDLAWSAGLFDGEGCIHIRKNEPTQISRHASTYYGLITKVTMTCKQTIERLKTIFAVGHISRPTKIDCNRSIPYSWACMSNDAFYVLLLLYPWLFLKKPQAILGIRFIELGPGREGRKKIEPALLEKRAQCYQQMRNLNLKFFQRELL